MKTESVLTESSHPRRIKFLRDRIEMDRLEGKLLDNSGMFNLISIVQTPSAQLDKVNIPFKLTWSHYQVLMRIGNMMKREFYEKEAIQSNRDVRTSKRQYNSSLYEAGNE